MAAEEDKKFDAVLGGFLVSDLRGHAGHLHCPESDVLAAYHERSLLPEEMNSWKEHMVGCARCQAVLAELEATDSISLEKASEKEVPLPAAAEPATAAREERDTPHRKRLEQSQVTSIPHRVRWTWLAPAGALAAGLLVWIAWHENQPPQLKTLSETKTAKLEPASPATPGPSATPQAPTSSSLDESRQDQLTSLSKDQKAVSGIASAEKSVAPENLKHLETSNSRRRVGSPSSAADKEAGERQEFKRDSALRADQSQNQPAQEAKAGVAGAMAETVEVQTSAANAQVQAQHAQQDQLKAQKVPRAGPRAQAESVKKQKPESPAYRRAATLAGTPAVPGPPPLSPAPAAAFNDRVSLELAGAIAPHVISAPDKKTLWRAGHAGMIEFSNNGGASWSRQTSNVLVDLTAGSAPLDKVCWIVGRAGTILLTTDAGTHWTILHSPLEEDLGGVRATDALHSTIWNLGNTKVFETYAGGLTWKPAASP